MCQSVVKSSLPNSQKNSKSIALFGLCATLLIGAIATYILSSISRFNFTSGVVSSVPSCSPPEGLALLQAYGGPIHFHHQIEASSEEVSQLFSQGLLHLFGYNQVEALRNFEAAASLDAKCVMCFYGIASAHGTNINSPIDENEYLKGREAIDMAEELAISISISALHKSLIAAQRIRFPPDIEKWRTIGSSALEVQYAAAMKEVYLQFSDNDDAAAMYVEALMNTSPWKYHTPASTNATAVTATSAVRTPLAEEAYVILKQVLHRNSQHPLALHLWIHLLENGSDPSEAEDAADQLATAPESNGHNGHLLHMPAHIYYKVGRYNDCVSYSEAAIAKDEMHMSNCLSPYFPMHSRAVLVECALMGGDTGNAIAYSGSLRNMHDFCMSNPGTAYPTPMEFTYLRFGRWEQLHRLMKDEQKQHPNEVASFPPFFSAMKLYARVLLLLSPYTASTRSTIRRSSSSNSSIRINIDHINEAKLVYAQLEEAVAAIPAPSLPKSHPFYPNTNEMGSILSSIAAAAISASQYRWADAAAMLQEAVLVQDEFALVEPETFYMPIRQCLAAVLLKQATTATTVITTTATTVTTTVTTITASTVTTTVSTTTDTTVDTSSTTPQLNKTTTHMNAVSPTSSTPAATALLLQALELLRFDLRQHPNNIFSLSGLSAAADASAAVILTEKERSQLQTLGGQLMQGPCCELNVC